MDNPNRNALVGTAPADTFDNIQATLAFIQCVTRSPDGLVTLSKDIAKGLNLALDSVRMAVASEQQDAKQRELER